MTGFAEPMDRRHLLKRLALDRLPASRFLQPQPEEPRTTNAAAAEEVKAEVPRKSEIDWDAVQRDRDAGMKLAELAAKYDSSTGHISTHTRPASVTPKRSPRKAKAQRAVDMRAPAPVAAMPKFSGLIERLKRERENLKVLIAANKNELAELDDAIEIFEREQA